MLRYIDLKWCFRLSHHLTTFPHCLKKYKKCKFYAITRHLMIDSFCHVNIDKTFSPLTNESFLTLCTVFEKIFKMLPPECKISSQSLSALADCSLDDVLLLQSCRSRLQ